MQYILGVDGGNTKTIAIVADLDGTILGTGREGCGDDFVREGRHRWFVAVQPDAATTEVVEW